MQKTAYQNFFSLLQLLCDGSNFVSLGWILVFCDGFCDWLPRIEYVVFICLLPLPSNITIKMRSETSTCHVRKVTHENSVLKSSNNFVRNTNATRGGYSMSAPTMPANPSARR